MVKMESYPARVTELGGLAIRRALPTRERRLVGPWCFLDRFGPLTFAEGKPMDVAPHPHIGLQTVTWLLDGEVIHHDSLGSEALIRPGELNLMTAGRGISHTEETPTSHSGRLNGVQLWVALPDAHRRGQPSFEHHASLPAFDLPHGSARLLIGSWAGRLSPALAHSPMTGAEITVEDHGELALPLDPAFEHGFVLLSGDAVLDGQPLRPDDLYYLPPGATAAALRSERGARVFLIGGTPFAEPVLMWWNFVARTPEEIEQARRDWQEHRFAEVPTYSGPRIEAPELALRLRGTS